MCSPWVDPILKLHSTETSIVPQRQDRSKVSISHRDSRRRPSCRFALRSLNLLIFDEPENQITGQDNLTGGQLVDHLQCGQEMSSSTTVVQDDRTLEGVDPSNPEHPLNWPSSSKWINVLLISSQGLLSPLCSTILAVGSIELALDFHVQNIYVPNVPVGMYNLVLG